MNIKKIYNLLVKEWPNISFNIEEEDNEYIELTAETNAKRFFDDDIFIRVIAYTSGSSHVFFVLDELDPTLETYQLINEFNENQSWAKAYIMESSNGRHYLKIHYAFLSAKNEKDVCECIGYALDDLVSEETLLNLKPLTDLTR